MARLIWVAKGSRPTARDFDDAPDSGGSIVLFSHAQDAADWRAGEGDRAGLEPWIRWDHGGIERAAIEP